MDDLTKALRRVLENPKFELIPLKNVLDQAKFLPEGATVSVTASPAKDMEATLDLSADLQQMGFDVVPHLSARMTKDRAHLEAMVARLDRLEMRRIFLVGGDADEPGEFLDGFSVLKALEEMGHSLTEIGVPSYPEGHADIPDEALVQALHDKSPHVQYLTTQMCFDSDAITTWLGKTRADGISLPVTLGMPGVADRLRLLKISARIGVGNSMSFLRKNSAVATKFVKPGGYSPAELLEGLGATLDDPHMNIAGVHIYTFNSCDTTEAWRQEYLADL
jgi:methylenetetrahydrofolate reductase (NADPH)